jgi:hypothetical protein
MTGFLKIYQPSAPTILSVILLQLIFFSYYSIPILFNFDLFLLLVSCLEEYSIVPFLIRACFLLSICITLTEEDSR